MHRPARGFVTPLTVISVGVLAMLLLAAVQTEGQVLSQSILSAVTPLIGVMILAAAGQALVIGTGGIDLSVPAAITVTGIILTTFTGGDASKLAPAIVIVLIAVMLMGLVNGILVEIFGLNSLVVTLAVGLLAIGLGRLYRGKLLSVTGVPEPLVDVQRRQRRRGQPAPAGEHRAGWDRDLLRVAHRPGPATRGQ